MISMRITVRPRECKVVVMGNKLIKGQQKHIHRDHMFNVEVQWAV